MERRPNDSAVSVNYFSDNTSKDLQYASASQPPDEKAPAPFTEEQRLAQEQETMEAIGQASSQITVDNDFDLETDDGYSSDIAGSTTTLVIKQKRFRILKADECSSISSSVRDYEFENGRRYHKFREGELKLHGRNSPISYLPYIAPRTHYYSSSGLLLLIRNDPDQ